MRRCTALVLVALLAGCYGTDDPPRPSIRALAAPEMAWESGGDVGGMITTDSRVRAFLTPPVGVTWHVGFTENVPLAQMTALYVTLAEMSRRVWEITEGQVYIARLRFFDNKGPGATSANAFQGVDNRDLDMVVYPVTRWSNPNVLAFVILGPGQGRTDRCMAVPQTVSSRTLVHEAGHMLFILSWQYADAINALDDEYAYDPDDAACVMELTWTPERLCSGGGLAAPNHLSPQFRAGVPGQPRSCWEQILADYPALRYTGANRATRAAPIPEVEYNDTP